MLQRIVSCVLIFAASTASVSAQKSSLTRSEVRWFLFVGQSIEVETKAGRNLRGTVDALFANAFDLTQAGGEIEIPYAAVAALRDPATGQVIHVTHPRRNMATKILAGAGIGAAGLVLFCVLLCPR